MQRTESPKLPKLPLVWEDLQNGELGHQASIYDAEFDDCYRLNRAIIDATKTVPRQFERNTTVSAANAM